MTQAKWRTAYLIWISVHMRQSFGFGLSFWAAEKQWFKIYVGLGSGEGVHPYFGIPRF